MNPDSPFAYFEGKEWDLYGADACCFKLAEPGLESAVFEAHEDPDDGYRSSLRAVTLREDTAGLVFSGRPVARARCRACATEPGREYGGAFDGIEWVDDSGHVWMYLGTADSDDYYPSFAFGFLPAPTIPTSEKGE
jgi:hypothetical protein